MNYKIKAFTLAELMVVMAILAMISATMFSVFNSARSDARDSARLITLQGLVSALDAYRNNNNTNYYPQPAMQSSNNLWWYKRGNQAKATCFIDHVKDANWVATSEIDYSMKAYWCWWDIVITKKKIESFNCDYLLTKLDTASWSNVETSETVEVKPELAYEGDDLNQFCEDELEKIKESDWISYNITKIWEPTLLDEDWKQTIIGFKWTLVLNKSWANSILTDQEDKIINPFNQIKSQQVDPMYKWSSFAKWWFGYFPYAVYRDNIGEDISWSNASMWGVQFQIAATFEKQDADTGEIKPETVILWNYKPKKWYPKSLIWNWQQIIVNEQKKWVKASWVAKPDMKDNIWIPYEVEI